MYPFTNYLEAQMVYFLGIALAALLPVKVQRHAAFGLLVQPAAAYLYQLGVEAYNEYVEAQRKKTEEATNNKKEETSETPAA